MGDPAQPAEPGDGWLEVLRRTWVLAPCLLVLGVFRLVARGEFEWLAPGFWSQASRDARWFATALVAGLLLHPLWPRWWTAVLGWLTCVAWILASLLAATAGC